MSDLESKVINLCDAILKADTEHWDVKNRAVLQMTELFRSYQSEDLSVVNEAFTPELFRALKEPVVQLICDLRSQQVRDTCTMLIELSKVCGEKLKTFLRDSFHHILEGVKVPNKVMSGYVDECILSLIRNSIFKSALQILSQEIRENKAKFVREKCLEYLNEILKYWDVNEKEVDPIIEALRVGLEDASVKAREIARDVYISLYRLHPRKAEKLRNDLPKGVQSKLISIEIAQGLNNSCDSESTSTHNSIRSGNNSNVPSPNKSSGKSAGFGSTASVVTTATSTSSAVKPHHHRSASGNITYPATPGNHHGPPVHANSSSSLSAATTSSAAGHHHHPPLGSASKTTGHPALHHHNSIATSTPATHSSVASRVFDFSTAKPPANSDSFTAGTKIATMSSVEQSSTARNALSRRRSVVKNPFAELSDSMKGGGTAGVAASNSGDYHDESFDSSNSPNRSPLKENSNHLLNHHPTVSLINPPKNDLSSIINPPSFKSDEFTPTRNEKKLPQALLNPDNSLPVEKIKKSNSNDKIPEHLSMNMKVHVTLSRNRIVVGTIRFIGHTLFAPGIWIGVELTSPDGKNNGSVQGHYYFQCPMNYGLFIREDLVVPIPVEQQQTQSQSQQGSMKKNVNFPPQPPPSSTATNTNNNNNNPIAAIRNEVKNSFSNPNSAKVSGVSSSMDLEASREKKDNTNNNNNNNSNTNNPVPTIILSQPSTDMTIFSGISEANFSYQSSVNSEKQAGGNSSHGNKILKSSSVLKVKLSKMMELLNHQLELVSQLEKEEKINFSSQNVLALRQHIQEVTIEELDILHTFQMKFQEFPSTNNNNSEVFKYINGSQESNQLR